MLHVRCNKKKIIKTNTVCGRFNFYIAKEIVAYRGDDISFVQPQIVTGKQFLNAMEITLQLSAMKNRPAVDALVIYQVPRFLTQIPLVVGEPLHLNK